MISPRLAAAVIVVVTLAFAATFIAQFLIPGYEPETAIYGMFAAIVAAAFAQRRKDDGGKQ